MKKIMFLIVTISMVLPLAAKSRNTRKKYIETLEKKVQFLAKDSCKFWKGLKHLNKKVSRLEQAAIENRTTYAVPRIIVDENASQSAQEDGNTIVIIDPSITGQ